MEQDSSSSQKLSLETAVIQPGVTSGAANLSGPSVLSPHRHCINGSKLDDIPEMAPSLPSSPLHLVTAELDKLPMPPTAVIDPKGSQPSVAVAPPLPSPSRASVVGTHASLENVITSRRLRSQFLIELAVRFAVLSNLKIMDYAIDVKHLAIGDKLGGGTFGTVCKAKLRGLDVAVKQLNSGALNPESILALKIEVEILSKLRHPNIVLFIGISLTPTFAAMVTEWCERGSLFDMLKSHAEKMPARTWLKFALDIARGMWYLHSSEKLLIIHRDLKSANVLVSLGGGAKVADFGLAVMKERSATDEEDHEFHGNAGTPQWMAPEIILKEEYGQKVDVYSFGILLTELLTRRMPFKDTYPGMDFKAAVLEKNERPTIPFWAMTSRGPASESHKLGELVMECTEMNPKKRPDFAQIIDILEGLFFTLEHNEIRAFEDYDLARWMECLDGGDFDEVTHSANEIADVLESVRDGKALHGEEKRLIFLQHIKPIIRCSLSRIGYGKAARLLEDGGAYEYESLSSEVITNLVRTVALMIEMTLDAIKSGLIIPNSDDDGEDFILTPTPSSSSLLSATSILSASSGATQETDPSLASLFPAVKPYQLEALVDMFLDASESSDDGRKLLGALVAIFHSPMIRRHPMVARVFQAKLELRMLESKTANLSLISGVSTTLLDDDDDTLAMGDDEEMERKDVEDSSPQSPSMMSQTNNSTAVILPAKTEPFATLTDKCQKFGLLPAKFAAEKKREEEQDVRGLEEEIARMEEELLAKKKRLDELKGARSPQKSMDATVESRALNLVIPELQ